MFIKTMLAFILLAVSAAASAEAPKATGVYLGLSAGVAVFDDDTFDGFFYDDEDSAVQGYVGYKFFKHFGIEARVADFGEFSNGFDFLEISSTSIHALGFIPFGDSGWELFGQIGLARISQDYFEFFNEDDTATTLGGGVRWHITPGFTIAAQIDAYVWEDSVNDDLGIGTNMLSVQFNF